MREQGESVAVTASTGVAAFNIGGSTIHSWMGIGLAMDSVETLCKKVRKNKPARERIRAAKYLIIDEVSMIGAELLDKIDAILRNIRDLDFPFGGIVLVLVADFSQTLPVFPDPKQDCRLAFESDAWQDATLNCVELTEQVRQQDDLEFCALLDEIRVGNLTNIGKLQCRVNAPIKMAGKEKPIKILGYNKAVDSYNFAVLRNLPGQSQVFWAKDDGDAKWTEYFDRNCLAPNRLELKVGAQVMLLFNLDSSAGLVNGAVGVVKEIGSSPIVCFSNGLERAVTAQEWHASEQVVVDGRIDYAPVATRRQIPLKLAYAQTFFKSQGKTLDAADIDLDQCFADGGAYTALSRVRSLNSLRLKPFKPESIKTNKKCVEFYSSLTSSNS